MSGFNTRFAYWKFAQEVRLNNRYIFLAETKKFLKAFKDMASKQVVEMERGFTLCRAQLGNDFRPLYAEDIEVDAIPCALSQNRMKPLSDKAKEGRANPKGIPYLYLSNNIETAIAECRPWLGQLASVGIFEIVRDLKLVQLIAERKEPSLIYLSEPSQEEINKLVWEDINAAFSEPVSPDDSTADYAPTQILAEVLKRAGNDGIIYKSKLGQGYNIVLFNINDAQLKSCSLYKCKKIDYNFEETESPYYVDPC